MINEINKIQSITNINSIMGAGKAAAAGESEAGTFGSIFQSAIDYVKETDAAKNEAQYLLATGQLDNPAELTIVATKAQIAVDLLVQLRNKALDAYNELKNIAT